MHKQTIHVLSSPFVNQYTTVYWAFKTITLNANLLNKTIEVLIFLKDLQENTKKKFVLSKNSKNILAKRYE